MLLCSVLTELNSVQLSFNSSPDTLAISMSLLRITENTFYTSLTLCIFIISVSQPSGLPLAVLSNHLLLFQKSEPEKSSRLKKCVLIMSEICREGSKEAGRGKSFVQHLGWLISIYC